MPDRDLEIKVKAKNETGGVFAGVREELEKLKRVAGGRSTTKELVETIAGGGAIAGIKIAADEISELFEKAGESALAFSNDLLEPREKASLLEETIKSIPFVGQGYKIGEGFGNLVAGIGRAAGASDEFVARWISADAAIAEAKKGLDALAQTKAFFDDGGKTAELSKRLVEAKEHGLELIRVQQEWKHGADEEVVRNLRERADNDVTMTPEQRDALRRNADILERRAEATDKAERDRINKDDADDRAKQAMESQTRVNAVQAEARQAGLRAQGKDLEADLDQIKANADAQIQEIQKRFADLSKKNPERSAALEAQALKETNAVKDRQQQQADDARRKDLLASANRQFEVDEVARKAKLEGLAAEAELGGNLRQLEYERAQITEKYAQQREEINKRLREDQTLNADQVKTLQATLKGLDQQEEKEKRIADAKRADFKLAESSGRGDIGLRSAFAVEVANIKGGLLSPDQNAAAGTTSASRGVQGNLFSNFGVGGALAGAGAGGAAHNLFESPSNKATADNTKKSADGIATLNTSITDLLNLVKQQQQQPAKSLFGSSSSTSS